MRVVPREVLRCSEIISFIIVDDLPPSEPPSGPVWVKNPHLFTIANPRHGGGQILEHGLAVVPKKFPPPREIMSFIIVDDSAPTTVRERVSKI